jgi:hypothetical protein
MWSIALGKVERCAAIVGVVLLGVSASAAAQQKTFEGNIVAVDGKAHTFTVKGSSPGETAEWVFQPGPASEFVINGEPQLFGELAENDHVIVYYASSGATRVASRVDRIRTGSREMTFTGNVIGVDSKAQTFTVRRATGGKVQEMVFHVSPSARLYISGDEVLLGQLRAGDSVTVAYDSAGKTHDVKHMKKRA